MPRIPFVHRAIDEAGNAIGGSPQQVRIYDDFACTVPSVVTDDSAGGTTIAQPITPNSGAYTTLAVTTAAVDTTITVASTTDFAVGQLITIYDPTNTVYRFVRAILAGPPRLTLESAVGFIFSTANTQVGNLDQVGIVGGWVLDTAYHFAQVTDLASGRKMPPTLISAVIGSANVGVLEEGAGGGTRPTINFIGDPVTAVDNPGATRVDVTFTGRFASGSQALPGVAATTDPDTGIWWEGGNQIHIVTFGKTVLKAEGNATAVNYFRFDAGSAGSGPIVRVEGTDVDVQFNIFSRGAGSVALFSGAGTRKLAEFINVASSVNYLEVRPQATGAGPWLLAAGSDTDIAIRVLSKGAAAVGLHSGAGARTLALFENVASSVNYFDFFPSATTAALQVQAAGTDSNIDIQFVPKGTGVIKYKGGAQLWPLSSKSSVLAADVTMTTANVWYDHANLGLSLEVGTWIVWTTLTVQSGNVAAGRVTARLTDGPATTHYGSTETEVPGAANDPVSLTVIARITLGSTTTIKAQAVCNQNAGAILATTPSSGSGATASTIVAFQVLTS